jgi:hypothetical protein
LQGCGLVTQDGGSASGGSASGGSASEEGPSGGSSGSGSASCVALDESACVASPDCQPYVGYAVDEDAACYVDPGAYLGCHHFSVACDAVTTVARDEAGQAWHFWSGCIPPTFVDGAPATYEACAVPGTGGLGGAGGEDEPTCFCSVK